ncbi:glycosyltransferase family 2 protein [Metalysinibacillus jejuensis]|uniref:glycosyltransferase family 2 protein n=1 Tax=Metalysinibacillus jejuensis TaxID=914327 RepID=UPI000D348530|nr:glycosyltransferase family 2 protein [Metalysinibacillus jejuensis]
MKLSIIVPCYNEEQTLQNFFDAINAQMCSNTIDYEIIFINDGSKDNSLNIMKQLATDYTYVRYISFSRNFGKEAGMLAGISYAQGDNVIIMDADLQHPPHLIPEMLQLANDGFDQVIAKRNRTGEGVLRTGLTRIYYKVINSLVDVKLVDGVGDFRLLSRKAVDSLLKLKEYNRFSKGLFSWIGFNEAVIEYDNVTRQDGNSKWSFKSLINYGIDGVISFNNKPLRLAIYLGLLVTLVDVLYVIYMFIRITLYGIDVPGYFTTIAAILLIGGLQLFFMGVIGEYIGRIYYEVKQRPHYIISEKSDNE